MMMAESSKEDLGKGILEPVKMKSPDRRKRIIRANGGQTLFSHIDKSISNKRKKNKKSPKLEEKKEEEEENKQDTCSIKIGDKLNLSDLLFTKTRNFLINKENKQVMDKDLAGKVILLQFMSLAHGNGSWRTVLTNLLDIYTNLQPKGGFEIVFVVVRDHIPHYFQLIGSTPHECFLEKFSTMPWPAIPLSDRESREHLETIFGISSDVPRSFIIDPRGVVLQCDATPLFLRYGYEAFPFTNERIQFLESEDDVLKKHPHSIKKLLASPERDYLINNKGDRVPLDNLDDKVVGLYFCPHLDYHLITSKLEMVYKELSNNKEDFEIVLIYAHGWYEDVYGCMDADSFLEVFETMPWLALPFEDTNCSKKLQRIFQYPQELLWWQMPDYRLVIVGPHGEFIEPWGANVSLMYGVPAYPFTSSSAANLELERVKKVKLEMLWDLDAVFTQKNGSKVQFSQLVGKRIIVFCQGFESNLNTLRELKARYFRMKGTHDEFEVIHVNGDRWHPPVAEDMPWLMHHPFDEDSYAGKFIKLIFRGNQHGLLAFDGDGSVVRRTRYPVFGDNIAFPFNPRGDMENEVLLEVERRVRFRIKINGGITNG